MNQDTRTSSESPPTRRELIEAIGRETRLSQNSTHAIDELFCLSVGINRTDARCMDLLDMFGPMTAGELADRTGLTSGAITAVLDRMERGGYLRRVRDPVDRRKVNVELTEEAKRISYGFYAPLQERADALLRRYSTDELRTALDLVRRGRAMTEGFAIELRQRIPRRSLIDSVRAVKDEAKAIKTEWAEEGRALKRELKEQTRTLTREVKGIGAHEKGR